MKKKTKSKASPRYDSERQTRVLFEQISSDMKRIAEKVDSNSEKLEKLDAIERDVKYLKSDMEVVKMVVKENAGDIRLLKQDVSGLKQDVSALKQDVSALKQDVSALKQDVSGLKQDVSALKQDVSALKQDVSALKQDVSGLKEGHGSLRESLIRIEDKFDSILVDHGERLERLETAKA